MACATPFDALRAKTESLGETLHVRASWRNPWLNVIPRGVYPRGEGYVRSAFTIGRSEPTSDEETWSIIQPIADTASGACALTYNTTTVGHKEVTYKPEAFGLRGPVICQDDLSMYWRSADFWEKYFQALEKRNRASVINRIQNVYMQYSHKASANASFAFTAGSLTQTTGVPAAVTMTDLDGANIPTSELTQEMLDYTAIELIEEGATEGDSNGWITLGADGPVFPILIGLDASQKILLNNSDLRSDYNNSFQGFKDANPVIQRLGASRVIKNFRHVVTPFPPRWKLDNDLLVRVPTWVMSSDAANATQGSVAVINPDWKDASVAAYEAAIVLNPLVMTEEVLQPTNSLPGAKFNSQNYFGEWQFVTGNDALLGMDSCTGSQDPLHKLGRHFAEYRHAFKPVHPEFGRMILFKRCSASFSTVACS